MDEEFKVECMPSSDGRTLSYGDGAKISFSIPQRSRGVKADPHPAQDDPPELDELWPTNSRYYDPLVIDARGLSNLPTDGIVYAVRFGRIPSEVDGIDGGRTHLGVSGDDAAIEGYYERIDFCVVVGVVEVFCSALCESDEEG